MNLRCLICSLLLTFPCLAMAEIEVQDTKGRKMKIEVLSYTASSGNVRIKRVSDGAIFNTKINAFDTASQESIRKAAPLAKAKLLSKVSVGRRRKNVRGSSYMERQTITAKATIENESRDTDFIDGTQVVGSPALHALILDGAATLSF